MDVAVARASGRHLHLFFGVQEQIAAADMVFTYLNTPPKRRRSVYSRSVTSGHTIMMEKSTMPVQAIRAASIPKVVHAASRRSTVKNILRRARHSAILRRSIEYLSAGKILPLLKISLASKSAGCLTSEVCAPTPANSPSSTPMSSLRRGSAQSTASPSCVKPLKPRRTTPCSTSRGRRPHWLVGHQTSNAAWLRRTNAWRLLPRNF